MNIHRKVNRIGSEFKTTQSWCGIASHHWTLGKITSKKLFLLLDVFITKALLIDRINSNFCRVRILWHSFPSLGHSNFICFWFELATSNGRDTRLRWMHQMHAENIVTSIVLSTTSLLMYLSNGEVENSDNNIARSIIIIVIIIIQSLSRNATVKTPQIFSSGPVPYCLLGSTPGQTNRRQFLCTLRGV